MKLFEGLAQYRPQALGVLRIMTALQFIEHGSQKLFNFPVGEHAATLTGLTLTAGILEFAGGILLALGLLTRPVAFLLAGAMAIARLKSVSTRLGSAGMGATPGTAAIIPERVVRARRAAEILERRRHTTMAVGHAQERHTECAYYFEGAAHDGLL